VKSHCVVGNGVVVHLRGLLNELKSLREADIDYAGDVIGGDVMGRDVM
jgi:adenylosuccinate synthase